MSQPDRRTFMGSVANGLQGAALASLFSQDLYGSRATASEHRSSRCDERLI